ncbi:MAG: hypothetical protein ACYC10_00135 [Allorhizobium sp.]
MSDVPHFHGPDDYEFEKSIELAERKEMAGVDTVERLDEIASLLRHSDEGIETDSSISSMLCQVVEHTVELQRGIRALNENLIYIGYALSAIAGVLCVGIWHFW